MNTVLKLDPTSCAVDSPDLYATETITTLDDLDRLESAWRSLGKNIGGPIEQFDWVRTCVDSARDNRDLNIATVTRGGRLTAVAPLSVKRVYGARRRVMLGSMAGFLQIAKAEALIATPIPLIIAPLLGNTIMCKNPPKAASRNPQIEPNTRAPMITRTKPGRLLSLF